MDHDCGSLRECATCGALVTCDGRRTPVCETCREIERRGRAPAGRVCIHESCGTVLSVYNRSSRCSIHAALTPTLSG
jgi:hypothetical protein